MNIKNVIQIYNIFGVEYSVLSIYLFGNTRKAYFLNLH
jgi:hypothetical protein